MHIVTLKVNTVKSKNMHTPKTRIYIFQKDETIIENLQNRTVRPYTTYKKEVIPEILQSLNLPAETKVKWSQKAGCACGCSPAFIVEGDYSKDVFVTISNKTPETKEVTELTTTN